MMPVILVFTLCAILGVGAGVFIESVMDADSEASLYAAGFIFGTIAMKLVTVIQ